MHLCFSLSLSLSPWPSPSPSLPLFLSLSLLYEMIMVFDATVAEKKRPRVCTFKFIFLNGSCILIRLLLKFISQGPIYKMTLVQMMAWLGAEQATIYNIETSCLLTHLHPKQNGCHFTDEVFTHIFLNGNVRISIKISMKFVSKGPITISQCWFR